MPWMSVAAARASRASSPPTPRAWALSFPQLRLVGDEAAHSRRPSARSMDTVGMTALVEIRGVDEGVSARLMGKAEAEGVSLNAYLVRLLEREAATPSREEVLARIAARAESSAVSAVDVIRAGRDGGRRA